MFYMCIDIHEILFQTFGSQSGRVQIFFAGERQSMVLFLLLSVN